ncbi:hypothetical protein HG535_0H00280 [Zygotorulaspora mrakii]|uniref:DUF1748-domain-containing protein n=1 Tax=Zygotorulaspora mrakii TaxID=42260 RepID=A0A7H9B870_ZYGMR|nr:uncharacterized protein HG535_0H00280 [Zygotorulaspora mrakii]QLG74703.1 hypothetical protein HG535_0H00280 [Zygotorulaspora mrakii]
MSVKSLLHWGFDLTLIAMVLAAFRQNTGYVFAYEHYGIGSHVYKLLSCGEWCYNTFCNYAINSRYFRKQLPRDKFKNPRIREVEELSRSDL